MAGAKIDTYVESDPAEVTFEETDALAADDPEALEAELEEALLELEIELEVVFDKLVEVVPLEALMLV